MFKPPKYYYNISRNIPYYSINPSPYDFFVLKNLISINNKKPSGPNMKVPNKHGTIIPL
jgi:hypothetical protein